MEFNIETKGGFPGDSLRHVLRSVKADHIVDWYNSTWNKILKENSPGRTHLNDHDLKIGKKLVAEFNFEEGALLSMDKGFLGSEWITYLKEKQLYHYSGGKSSRQ